MARRSTPQAKTDDHAFPVRVKVRVPERGFGMQLGEIHAWLNRELGPGNHAHHGVGLVNGTGFYFRTVEAAEAFLAAFPELELADGIERRFSSK